MFLHEDARTRGCMWDPPASITSSPHIAHTGSIHMQGTIQLLGSSPPAVVLGSARLVLGGSTTAQHKSQTSFSVFRKADPKVFILQFIQPNSDYLALEMGEKYE